MMPREKRASLVALPIWKLAWAGSGIATLNPRKFSDIAKVAMMQKAIFEIDVSKQKL